MKEYNVTNSVLDMVGNTPMIEITKINTGKCRLFVKLENQNPGGSIKDRIGLSMITIAEQEGKLKPGDTIIEATAGNTGLGLALIAKMKNYKLKLVIPDKMSQEKINHLRALGVEVIITRSDVIKGHPEYYQDLAQQIAKDTGAYYINQFENPANPLAHETTTGPEIWQQMNKDVDAVVVGVGSSGTLTGLTHFFKKVSDKTEFVLADPNGSILADYVNKGIIRSDSGSWLVEGIGEDFIPSIADFSLTNKAYSISDKESFDAVYELLNKEGILAGSSSGTLLSAAIKYCQEQTEPKRVVTLVCDSGNKYLSKMYNNYWLQDNGLENKKVHNDLRDFAQRNIEDKAIIYAQPSDTLLTVYKKMKLYDISQLPILKNNKAVGIIDDSDLLKAYIEGYTNKTPVSQIMAKNLVTIPYTASYEQLLDILNEGYVAILEGDAGLFVGLVTKIDILTKINNNRTVQA
ncbi:pyridoxal-phosphate dependent enzyme [uncultured Dysgonomonas sp.]|uniref:pyridoxal-phosphate dependent enzyme n=2 Tax=Dysgonomonas TaxID=156973 RepID=UPI0028049B28|nr:pyridoxal-phosphate dependent enzyme [uncultured Dysgonomonas sp.]